MPTRRLLQKTVLVALSLASASLATACGTSQGDPDAAVCAPACGAAESCADGVCQPDASLAGTAGVGAAGTGAAGVAGAAGNVSGGGGGGLGTPAGGGAAGTVGSDPVSAAGAGAAGADTSNTGGATAGTAGTSASGAAGTNPGAAGEGAAAGAGPIDPPEPTGAWHGAIAQAVTAEMLQTEYAAWKNAHVVQCDNGTASVDKGDGRAVSEGIAYGMLLSANMDDRPLFDQLWQFYNDHLDANGLMNWDQMPPCAAPGNNNSNAATDAEMDALMALLQAGARWPDGAYLADAEALASKVLQFEVEECDGRTILRPGDRFGGCSDMFNQRINPSYFSPGYYRAFAHHFPAQAPTWNSLLEGTYELYAGYDGAAADGPYPDWSNTDGSANGSGYGYDAARTPWRIATDYAWTAEPRAASELARVTAYVEAAGGIPVGSQDNNSTFSGAFALAAIGDQATLDQYTDAWLTAGGDDAPYFQGTLRVLYLLLAGGQFPSTL